jgi:N-acetylglucosaminyl-diphospho-decaprenol L-rhamnosyltransferase
MSIGRTVSPTPIVLSVLVVNYNGRHLLDDCLRSLAANVTVPYEVVVVDNASGDGSAAHLAQHHPGVKLVAHDRNAGFAGGNNLAARHARGRYLLLLNTDTVVQNSIDPLVTLLEREPALGALGCRLVYADGRQQESIGHEPGPLRLALSWLPLGPLLPGWPLMRRTVPATSPRYRAEAHGVDWISGAFLLTPRALWERMGGLDERYFMYLEDTDYCRRVRDAGHRIGYSPACTTVHLEGAGRPWIGERAVLDTTASYLRYCEKHRGSAAVVLLALLLPPVFLLRSAALLGAACVGRDRFGKAKARAFARAALQLLGAVTAARRGRIETVRA